MCRATTCRTCGKTTWAGCGQHVDQVMAGVPRANRCAGHSEARTPTNAEHTNTIPIVPHGMVVSDRPLAASTVTNAQPR